MHRLEARFVPYSVDVSPTLNWVTGGSDVRLLDSTEFYDGIEFQEGPRLPRRTHAQCVVMISENEAMIMTGEAIQMQRTTI